MNALLAVVNRVQVAVFHVLDVLTRGVTALLARVLRRGKHRAWRKGI